MSCPEACQTDELHMYIMPVSGAQTNEMAVHALSLEN